MLTPVFGDYTPGWPKR